VVETGLGRADPGTGSFRIVVRGELSDRFCPALGTSTLARSAGRTAFVLETADQAALHGVFARLHALGIDLVSVEPVAGPA
jgi:hypothetical protein